jgi:IS30 family transposase
MLAYQTERDVVRQRYLRSKLRQKDLGRRIANLDGSGFGVREIARILGVNPSTVSRRLRRTL